MQNDIGCQFFLYAARQTDQWWVLRLNFGFAEHDMYTLFVDATPGVDITDDPHHPTPLVRIIAALSDPSIVTPTLDAGTAATVVKSRYVNDGSKRRSRRLLPTKTTTEWLGS
ncbi:hypothetical protein A5725_13630 [Mycobacterium kubicae]|uniref:hypothetical protein n=1 Tax=Mycobacterium kubicae TaxID=120959 RepID=UPI0008013BDD|nr:hypothetical protein [Mycobacterium kubicae]OBF21627.1 hypothetical protein A5725_13630 [Mycobacterium kubicae]